MAGVFGVVTLIFMIVLLLVITPEYETQVRGWRRARKLGEKRLPRLGDSASSFLVGVDDDWAGDRGLVFLHRAHY